MIETLSSKENFRALEIGQYKMFLERRDPHGFWYFKWSAGAVPEKLQDAYTGLTYAYEALQNWYDQLPPRMKPVERAIERSAKRTKTEDQTSTQTEFAL